MLENLPSSLILESVSLSDVRSAIENLKEYKDDMSYSELFGKLKEVLNLEEVDEILEDYIQLEFSTALGVSPSHNPQKISRRKRSYMDPALHYMKTSDLESRDSLAESYRDFKTTSPSGRVKAAIKEANNTLRSVRKTLENTVRLKSESDISPGSIYTKRTSTRIKQMTESILEIARTLKELQKDG